MDYDKIAGKLGGSSGGEIDYDKLAGKVGGTPTEEPASGGLVHQLGLTARAGIEGLANSVGLVSDPVISAINGINHMAGGAPNYNKTMSDIGQMVANGIGLPQPLNARERNVQAASKLLAGTGGIVRGAESLANNATGQVAQGVGRTMSNQPIMQAAGAVGAGYAGNAAKEAGYSPAVQFGASLAGGLGVPLSAQGLNSFANKIKNFIATPKPAQVESAIQAAGLDLGQMSDDVAGQIRKDVQGALKTGEKLDPDAIRRLADYRTLQVTPTRGSVTLNPADVTADRNLAKVGANSKDPAAQQLANVANANEKTLVGKLNTMGAETADDTYNAGKKVIQSLQTRDAQEKAIIGGLYNKARETNGRSALIDPHAFTNQANDLLDNSLLSGKLPADVRNKLNSIAQGKTPLTVDVAEQFKTNIGNLQRASTDPAERLALGHVRSALDDAPLLQGQGQEAINAFNTARVANKSYMQLVEKTPALQAVRDGVDPDKFVKDFIVGNGTKSNVSDLAALKSAIGKDPEATQVVKDQIVSHLKNKALNGGSEEVSNFSPKAFNKAVSDIGDLKLSMFFSPEEINTLKTIGRVASYEKFQPTGSAVNNSNTAAATVTALLDKVANSGLVRKIPIAGAMAADNAKSITTGIGARKALDVSKAISQQTPKTKTPTALPLSSLLIPATVSKQKSNDDEGN